MSGDSNTAGQVLGASTAIGGGIVMLPATGDSLFGTMLCSLAIILGSLCLISFILSKILRRIINSY